MAGLSAALQRRVLCNCGNFCVACTRSENLEFTIWARSRHAATQRGPSFVKIRGRC